MMKLTGISSEVRSSRPARLSLVPLACFLIFSVSSFSTVYADVSLLNKINSLNQRFQNLSHDFYKSNSASTSSALDNMAALQNTIQQLSRDGRVIDAIQQLYLNIGLIEDNLEHRSIPAFISILLDHNELRLANRLLDKIKTEGDDFQLARSNFLYAKYHARQLDWEKVKQLLLHIPTELSVENAAYASLLQGIALQKSTLHRRAQESYQKIPQDSDYYWHAQLNLAIAQIRQGWLTSAQQSISTLIAQAGKRNVPDDFINRLYLVQGYALLQKDYYRSARESFRKISLDSRYTNRAMLGIALCVINMGEFENGLNTLSLLKARNSTDLSVEESYLLTAYVYEKLQQQLDVSSSYTEAIAHYQNRINGLQKILQRQHDFNQVKLNDNLKTISIGNHQFEYAGQFPDSFIKNHAQLLQFSLANNNSLITHNIDKLTHEYRQLLQLIIANLVKQKIDHLSSYLSQSRYGLATLYDKSKQE